MSPPPTPSPAAGLFTSSKRVPARGTPASPPRQTGGVVLVERGADVTPDTERSSPSASDAPSAPVPATEAASPANDAASALEPCAAQGGLVEAVDEARAATAAPVFKSVGAVPTGTTSCAPPPFSFGPLFATADARAPTSCPPSDSATNDDLNLTPSKRHASGSRATRRSPQSASQTVSAVFEHGERSPSRGAEVRSWGVALIPPGRAMLDSHTAERIRQFGTTDAPSMSADTLDRHDVQAGAPAPPRRSCTVSLRRALLWCMAFAAAVFAVWLNVRRLQHGQEWSEWVAAPQWLHWRTLTGDMGRDTAVSDMHRLDEALVDAEHELVAGLLSPDGHFLFYQKLLESSETWLKVSDDFSSTYSVDALLDWLVTGFHTKCDHWHTQDTPYRNTWRGAFAISRMGIGAYNTSGNLAWQMCGLEQYVTIAFLSNRTCVKSLLARVMDIGCDEHGTSCSILAAWQRLALQQTKVEGKASALLNGLGDRKVVRGTLNGVDAWKCRARHAAAATGSRHQVPSYTTDDAQELACESVVLPTLHNAAQTGADLGWDDLRVSLAGARPMLEAARARAATAERIVSMHTALSALNSTNTIGCDAFLREA